MPIVIRRPLTDPLPGVPLGTNERLAFASAWGDPARFPLNRPYGDEFEYTSFNAMRRKWTMFATTAADFDFHVSSVGWKPPTSSCGFYTAVPAGDIECVLEVGMGGGVSSGNGLLLGLVNAAGTGASANLFNNQFTDTWVTTAWALGANVNGTVPNIVFDGSHKWLSIRRTGTTLQIRTSNTGLPGSWTSLTGGTTVSTTAPFFAIFVTGGVPPYVNFYRFNVYGPGFFTG